MKKTTLLKPLITFLLICFVVSSQAAGLITNKPDTAKQTPTDTSWKPVRRIWGLAFGDMYYDAHADAANRGAETNYNNVPTYRNAYQFRRIYLGYDYDIDKRFTVEILLASEPGASTSAIGTSGVQNGDNLADGKMAFFIKNFDLRWKGIWNGSDLVVGEMWTPATVLLSEKIWGYRSIEKTIADLHHTNLYDVGAALEGTFDPKAKNYGYDVMVGNNSTASLLSATNPNSGFFKAFYGDVYARFFDQQLVFDFYADYMQTASSTALVGTQSHGMYKGFVAYTTPQITFGLEAFTNKITNGLTATNQAGDKTAVNANVEAFSIYTHGVIYKDKFGFFARYDSYNPDADFSAVNTYTVNTNLASYSPYTKEHFVTAGFDFTPSKNVHFMPNIWYMLYQDQRQATNAGYIPEDHVIVYRATFYFMFGR